MLLIMACVTLCRPSSSPALGLMLLFLVGDGDNVHFLETSRREWMQQRVDMCAADPSYSGCFPLTWTISPRITYMAPDWLEWYYNKALETKNDYFMLPPSGDLYSYPAEMPEDVLSSYVSSTEKDCELLSTSGTIEWEWIGHWKKAMSTYFPKYAANNIVRGVFTTNVPFMLPIPTLFRPGEYFKIVSDNVVVFKPREWRGTEEGAAPLTKHNYLSVEQMAYELNHLPLGTVSWIYVTSDGGAGIDLLYDLVQVLDEHVKVVNHESLVSLALQKGKV